MNTYGYVKGSPLKFADPLGLCACAGGTWDQSFGDASGQVAVGGYGSGGTVNLSCRSNKSLKCKAQQVCIGGGPMVGGGVGWALGGVSTGANDSNDLRGWGQFQLAIGAGPLSGQGGPDGGQTGIGLNLGWRLGAALIRCYTTYLECNCPCESK